MVNTDAGAAAGAAAVSVLTEPERFDGSLDHLEQAARARGDQRVVLSAQRSAEGFYQRLGYQPVGEPYDEVGIAHIGMARLL